MQVCFCVSVCSVCEDLVSGNSVFTFSSISLVKNVFTLYLWAGRDAFLCLSLNKGHRVEAEEGRGVCWMEATAGPDGRSPEHTEL